MYFIVVVLLARDIFSTLRKHDRLKSIACFMNSRYTEMYNSMVIRDKLTITTKTTNNILVNIIAI